MLSKSKLDDGVPVLARDIVIVHTRDDIINGTLREFPIRLATSKEERRERTAPWSIRGWTRRGNIAGR